MNVSFHFFKQFHLIRGQERMKFGMLCFLMFGLFFNYTLLRPLKDTLIVTSPHSGAEVITFIKVWLGLPAALITTFLLRLSMKKISRFWYPYVLTIGFAIFFSLHAFVLTPRLSFLQPEPEKILELQTRFVHFKWIFPLIGNWVHVLFFTSAELWGSTCFYYLFWQIANQLTTKEESVRFFSLFGLIGNLAMIVAGRLTHMVTTQYTHEFEKALQVLIGIWLGMLGLVYLVYGLYARYSAQYDSSIPKGFFKETPGKPIHQIGEKITFKQQLSYFIENPKLLSLFGLVVAYGATFNFLESLWKSQTKQAYAQSDAYSAFMGLYFEWTGWLSIVFTGLGGWILRRFGWWKSAIMTPMTLLTLGTSYFVMVSLEHYGQFLSKLHISPLGVAWFGFVVNVLLKSSKFSFYDSSRELVYMSLSDDEKSKGKSGIDMLGAPSGKAMSSLSQQILLVTTAGTQISIAPFSTLLFLGLLWIWWKSLTILKPYIKMSHP